MTNIAAAVVTTFGNTSWEIYSKAMLTGFVKYWPKEIPIMINLDNDLLEDSVKKLLRPQDGAVCGWEKEHNDFIERNKDKDDKTNYRRQVVRFCHKVFALKFACDAAMRAREAKADDSPRYLIWLDADVITTAPVTFDDIALCIPKEGDAVAYMGRKDWDHSECGWLAFDLVNGGDRLIERLYQTYIKDEVLAMEQWHDSWVFDRIVKADEFKATNLTANKPDMDIWQHSPMAKFSVHHKGPIAKDVLAGLKGSHVPNMAVGGRGLRIQTKNSVPDPEIQRNILENQTQITNWVRTCVVSDEEVVIVSAGPMLVAEDLAEEVKAGRKIFAVKHALEPLEAAGIKPYACILLDPRDHVANFVQNPNKDVIWFVASQVIPKAVKTLLDAGCTVWGYHAAVGANESNLTERQPDSVIHGGSATATRGLFLLDKLGFRNFRLYGYDLCLSDKPNLGELDAQGQPKNFEITLNAEREFYRQKRGFWSEGQLIAQYEEIAQILSKQPWGIKAFGNGIVPFMVNAERVNNLRAERKKAKLGVSKPVRYQELLECSRKTPFWVKSLRKLRLTRRKHLKAKNS